MSARLAIFLVMIGCSSSHPAAAPLPIAIAHSPPAQPPAIDAGPIAVDADPVVVELAKPAPDAAEVPKVVEVEVASCRALATKRFVDCEAIELDGKPPCEIACTRMGEAPDYSPDKLHMIEHVTYYSSAGNQIGRIVTYDGYLDWNPGAQSEQARTHPFVDRSTTPPTLELRAGGCLFACTGIRPDAKRVSDCRASCPPIARYRYDGKQLRRIR